MRTSLGALALLIFVSWACAGELVPLDTERTPELTFRAQAFGAPPSPALVCVHGRCLNDRETMPHPVALPFSVYQHAGDPLAFAGLPARAARYSFWEERLFRVTFRVDCPDDRADACLDTAAAHLDALYGLTLLGADVHDQPARAMTSVTRRYVTRSGALVVLSRLKSGGAWELPLVSLIDQGGLERAARAANPRYDARIVWVPADYAEPR